MTGAKPTAAVVQIVLPGVGTLELTREAYDAALRPITTAPATGSAPAGDQPAVRLVNAKVLAGQLSLPVSCIYEYARAGRIPCVRLGKHVRFSPGAVRAALASTVDVTVGRE
jgi:excisionase family DNA binding protein